MYSRTYYERQGIISSFFSDAERQRPPGAYSRRVRRLVGPVLLIGFDCV
jgi:hypothetical protein